MIFGLILLTPARLAKDAKLAVDGKFYSASRSVGGELPLYNRARGAAPA